MLVIGPLLRSCQYPHSRATDDQTDRNSTVFRIIVEGDLQHTYKFICYDETGDYTHDK